MLKGFFNVVLAFIICITGSSMLIDRETFKDFSKNFLMIHKNERIVYSIDMEEPVLKNPLTVNLYVTSEHPLSITAEDFQKSLVLDVIQEHQKLTSFHASSFILAQQTSLANSKFTFTIDLSQDNINLPDGNYIFQIYSTAKEFDHSDPLQLHITYMPISKYVAAGNKLERGMMGLTLYFPADKNHEYLVPITRFVRHNRAVLRTAINQLQAGAVQTFGFENPIPEIPRLQVQRDMVIVHLPTNLGKYNENQKDGYFALNSIVNSLTNIPGINKVKFLVNGQESDSFFYGYSTKTIFQSTAETPRVYLGLDNNRARTLLVPIDIESMDKESLYREMFRVLQTGKLGRTTLSDLIPPVPNNIKLINAKANGSTLILNFSKEFLYAYPEREDLRRMILDAILFSYTSIKEIDKVQILVEDQAVDSYGGIKLSVPLAAPKFINPE